jgi:hypothetical protein
MFEFVCPRCAKIMTVASAPGGQVLPCQGCGQRLRVVQRVVEEGVSLLDGAEPRAPARGCVGPVFAAVCIAVGILGAAAILLAWAILGRGPAPDTASARIEVGTVWRS